MLSNEGAITEATKILTATIAKLNSAVVKVYSGNAVFAVISVNEHHSRSKRQTAPTEVSRWSLKYQHEHQFEFLVLESLQPGCVDRRRLPSHLQHHVLVHHHLCVLTSRHFARLEQCRRQRLNHLPHDWCSRQEGQLSPQPNLLYHRRDSYSQEAIKRHQTTDEHSFCHRVNKRYLQCFPKFH